MSVKLETIVTREGFLCIDAFYKKNKYTTTLTKSFIPVFTNLNALDDYIISESAIYSHEVGKNEITLIFPVLTEKFSVTLQQVAIDKDDKIRELEELVEVQSNQIKELEQQVDKLINPPIKPYVCRTVSLIINKTDVDLMSYVPPDLVAIDKLVLVTPHNGGGLKNINQYNCMNPAVEKIAENTKIHKLCIINGTRSINEFECLVKSNILENKHIVDIDIMSLVDVTWDNFCNIINTNPSIKSIQIGTIYPISVSDGQQAAPVAAKEGLINVSELLINNAIYAIDMVNNTIKINKNLRKLHIGGMDPDTLQKLQLHHSTSLQVLTISNNKSFIPNIKLPKSLVHCSM